MAKSPILKLVVRTKYQKITALRNKKEKILKNYCNDVATSNHVYEFYMII